jgi:hypothetical protein
MARDQPQFGDGGQGQSVRAGRRPPRSGAPCRRRRAAAACRHVRSIAPRHHALPWMAVAEARLARRGLVVRGRFCPEKLRGWRARRLGAFAAFRARRSLGWPGAVSVPQRRQVCVGHRERGSSTPESVMGSAPSSWPHSAKELSEERSRDDCVSGRSGRAGCRSLEDW